jgi:phosphatidate cytidylyltransferase
MSCPYGAPIKHGKDRMNSGTGLRILTAAILIPLVVALIWWGPTWLLALAALLVALAALWEFFSIAEAHGFHAYREWASAAAVGIFAQQFYVARQAGITNLSGFLNISPHVTLELVLFVFVIGVAINALASSRPLDEVLPSISVSVAGLLFIVLPFSAVVRLHAVDGLGRMLLLFTAVLVWVGDSAAYFVGRAIGRHKLAPHSSPGKTWEGAAANLLGALLVAVAFGYRSTVPPVHMLAMAAVGSVAGQIGDLFESAWKRSSGVKDSGTILPGHGGILDRIDALILAAPAVWYYFEWVVSRRY